MRDLVLKPGRDRSVRRRHPWVLSGSVAQVDAGAEPGDEVRVVSAEGEPLGHGFYSPRSALRVRLHVFGKEPAPSDWIAQRIEVAVERRRRDPGLAETDAMRLVNSEGDGVPGLVADRYADLVVVRIGTPGLAARREEIARALAAASGATAGCERADAAATRREGFASHDGALWGEPPSRVEIREGGARYLVDAAHGQKTGFYLDQREARARVAEEAPGRRVLDLFAYSGSFAVAAARGGAARVTVVESSRPALELARENAARNDLDAAALEFVEADAFEFLRRGEERFDLIVLDPPPLARRRADAARASRAYKDLLLHALRRVTPGGLVFAFRCSQAVDDERFRQIAFGASLDAGRPVQVIGRFTAPPDHPVALDHPEGDYYGGLLLRA